jgi:hypothetical protein
LQLSRSEFWTVYSKLKAVPRHGLAFAGELHLQETKRAARFLPRRTDA